MIFQIIFKKKNALRLVVIVTVVLAVQCQAMERDGFQGLSSIVCTKPEYSFGNPAVDSIANAEDKKSVHTFGQMVAWKNNYLLISSPLMNVKGNRGRLTVLNTKTREIVWSIKGTFYNISFCSQGLEFAAIITDQQDNMYESHVYAIKSRQKTMSHHNQEYWVSCLLEWISRDEIIICSGEKMYKMNLKTAAMSDFLMSKDCYGYPRCVAIRNGGIAEMTIGGKDEIKIVDSVTGVVKKASPPLGKLVCSLSWNSDGEKLLACVNSSYIDEIGSLWVYSLDNLDEPILKLRNRSVRAKWLDNDRIVTTDGTRIYIQKDDDTIEKIFQKIGENSDAINDCDFINDICINSEGTKIASATKNSVDIWPIDDEKLTEK